MSVTDPHANPADSHQDVVAYLSVTLKERMLVPVLQERLLQKYEALPKSTTAYRSKRFIVLLNCTNCNQDLLT
jgi:hypothetical protein